VASAEQVYADPSALACLYLHQADRSRRLIEWRMRNAGAMPITHHGKTEVINAICRAGFERRLDAAGMDEALADFEADFSEGRLVRVDILWRATLDRAAALSRTHAPTLGACAADVCAACCLRLGVGDWALPHL
jgi:hypothetical protein